MRTKFALASGSKSTYRGLGSIDFQETARSVLVVGRIKDDMALRVIAHDKSRGQKTKEAKSFLAEILAEGQLSCNEIAEAAKERGIKKKTLWNAKKEMNIDSVKVGNQWYWTL